MTLVSVVIPAYNAASTLEATLASVRVQTHRRLEIVIVDDGSGDGTRAILDRHAVEDPRIAIIYQANRGVAAARNTGIAHATGEWIATIDADDLWHPEKIARQLAAARAGGDEVGLVYCWSRLIDPEGRAFHDLGRSTYHGCIFEPLLCRNFIASGSVVLARKDLFAAVGDFDADLRAMGAQGAEDLDMYLRLARVTVATVAPAFLVAYRQRPGSMSRSADQMRRSIEIVLDRHGAAAPRRVRAIAKAFYDIYIGRMHSGAGRYRSAARYFLGATLRAPMNAVPMIAVIGAHKIMARFVGIRPPVPFEALDPAVRFDQPASRMVEGLREWQIARALRPPRREGKPHGGKS